MRTSPRIAADTTVQGAIGRDRSVNSIGIACPSCHVPAGTACTTRSSHQTRRRMALRAETQEAS